jgi:phage tail-like protein
VSGDKNPANSTRFDVTIDGREIGSFTAVEGLTAQYEIKTYAEGGENSYVHRLPGRLSFGTVKLTRPVEMRTRELSIWFLSFAEMPVPPRVGHTAAITAFNDNRASIVQWEFTGVWPVSYTGPSFSVDGAKVALEVFEFAHDGWIER